VEQLKTHALAAVNSKQYGHFRPTLQRYPSYSAGIVPFRWMMRENLNYYRDLLDLDVDEEREPDRDAAFDLRAISWATCRSKPQHCIDQCGRLWCRFGSTTAKREGSWDRCHRQTVKDPMMMARAASATRPIGCGSPG
jgi:hypothetical protein